MTIADCSIKFEGLRLDCRNTFLHVMKDDTDEDTAKRERRRTAPADFPSDDMFEAPVVPPCEDLLEASPVDSFEHIHEVPKSHTEPPTGMDEPPQADMSNSVSLLTEGRKPARHRRSKITNQRLKHLASAPSSGARADVWPPQSESYISVGACKSSTSQTHGAESMAMKPAESSDQVCTRYEDMLEPSLTERMHEPMREEQVYTVMVRNIPCSCKRQEVIDAIEEVGFKNRYDFFYLPTRYSKYLGYAFVGFPDPQTTKEFTEAMTGYRFRNRKSQKVVSVVPAHIQGIDNNMKHFQDLYVMRTRHVPTFNFSDLSCVETPENHRHRVLTLRRAPTPCGHRDLLECEASVKTCI